LIEEEKSKERKDNAETQRAQRFRREEEKGFSQSAQREAHRGQRAGE
jgi:hypothetical protein